MEYIIAYNTLYPNGYNMQLPDKTISEYSKQKQKYNMENPLKYNDIENEIWKPIEGFEGIYEVSNFGRVKSIDRYVIYKNGHKTFHKGRIIRQIDNFGYKTVHLHKDGKQTSSVRVHRLVAIAFIPNPLNLPIVNHKDEDRANNIVENLEWCDSKYNNNYGNHNLNISKSQKGIKHGPLTPEKREQFRLKRNKTMMKKYGRIGPILTEEVRKKHSERMKKKNPMFNIDIKNKMIKTL